MSWQQRFTDVLDKVRFTGAWSRLIKQCSKIYCILKMKELKRCIGKLISDVNLKGKCQSHESYPKALLMTSPVISTYPCLLHLRLMDQLRDVPQLSLKEFTILIYSVSSTYLLVYLTILLLITSELHSCLLSPKTQASACSQTFMKLSNPIGTM